MFLNRMLTLRLILTGVFAGFIIASVSDQYDLVEATVRFICIDCLGLNG